MNKIAQVEPRLSRVAQAIRLALRLPLMVGALGTGAASAETAGVITPVAFDGTNLGAIPDGPAGCGTPGAPRDVMFNVPLLTGREVVDVEAELTFGAPIHTWAGDITARLIAPTATSHLLFGRVGATTAAGCGDSSNLAGPYVFTDAATPPSGGFWQEATARLDAQSLTPGSYFTTGSGGAGATNPMPPTSMQPVFAGMSAEQAVGTWTLRLTDSGGGDTGAIAAARLFLYLEVNEAQIFADGFEFTLLVRNGSNLGAIPDGPPAQCGTPGAARDVTFAIPAFPGFRVSDVDVQMQFSPVHTWAGDVTATLFRPNGDFHTLFGRVGSTTAAGCGDSSNLAGPYVFTDAATPPSGGFWQEAAARGDLQSLTAGSYFTTGSGGAGAMNPMPPTSLQAKFGGMASTAAAGTWTLRLTDSGGGDTGAISAARLILYVEPDN